MLELSHSWDHMPVKFTVDPLWRVLVASEFAVMDLLVLWHAEEGLTRAYIQYKASPA